MHELQNVFNYQGQEIQIVEKDGMPEHLLVGDVPVSRFDLLSAASKAENKKEAWQILETASRLFHWQEDSTFNNLYAAVAMQITLDSQTHEYGLHSKFNDRVQILFGNEAAVIKKVNDYRHQPDSWIRINNEDIPVEMKMKKFNKKALNQLLRYMDFYKCSRGIAVGSELSVDLPENITFISSNQLD